jgi:GNAT superfamily N-acetyltransferase
MVRAIHRAAVVLARTAGQVREVQGGQVCVRADRPGVRAVNFAADVQLPESISSEQEARDWLALILSVFADQRTPCHVLYPRQSQWALPLKAALDEAGYEPVVRKVFELSRYRGPASVNQAVQVAPARALYPQLPEFYFHQAHVEHHADERLANDYAATMIDFLDEPRLELFIARMKDQRGLAQNVAVAGVLSLGQTGVVIPAWTDPAYRGKGVAGTLMNHVMDACARALFTQVILDRSTHCPAIGFYEAMGFTQIDTFVKYRLRQPQLAALQTPSPTR